MFLKFPGIFGEFSCWSMDMFDMFNLFPFYYLEISHYRTAVEHRVLGHELCKIDP